MSDNRAYDPDEYFGRASPREVPDVKAEAAERLRQAIAYARLHAPELLEEWPGAARTCAHWPVTQERIMSMNDQNHKYDTAEQTGGLDFYGADPNTMTTFRGGLKRETAYELARALGQDARLPVVLGVIVTALGGLSREAQADVIQFLNGQALKDDGEPREMDPTMRAACEARARR
jgi:hypothetical protein